MDIKINSFSSYAFSFFQENLAPSLTAQQKKILIIASVIFGCLAAYYVINRYFKTQVEVKKEEEFPALDMQHDFGQSQPLELMVSSIESHVKTLKAAWIDVQSAKCFVKVDFENGGIKKEFVFKKLDGTSLETEFMVQQLDKMQQYLKGEMKKNLYTTCTKVQWIMLFKDSAAKLHKSAGDRQFLLQQESSDAKETVLLKKTGYAGDISLKENISKEVLVIAMRVINQQMGFPKGEKQVDPENGSFIPGSLYQALN